MAKGKRTFGTDDIERWIRVYSKDPEFYASKVEQGSIERGRALSELSRSHEYLGLISIALAQYGKALGHFRAAAGAWAYLLERYVAGEDLASDLIERCSSQPFNLALAANDQTQVERLAKAYEAAFPHATAGKNDLHWMGAVTAALASGRTDLASEWIGSPPATVNPATARYYSCLLDHDELQFAQSMLRRAENWKRRIRSEGLSKFPDAVCDHPQIGSIRLFERLWGYRPTVDLAAGKIPPEIFDSVAEPVERG